MGVISGTRGSSLTGPGRTVGSGNGRDSDPAPAEDSATHSGGLDDWLHSSMTDCSTQWRTPGMDQRRESINPGELLNHSMFAKLSCTNGHRLAHV